ncbi:P-loop NTPase, partial [Cognatilysobacter segetis]
MSDPLARRLDALPLNGFGVTVGEVGRVSVGPEGPGGVVVDITFGVPIAAVQHEIVRSVAEVIALVGRDGPPAVVRQRIGVHAPQAATVPLANVRNLIAVGSGKGGVGKSTVAVNLAVALAREGARVGILDADIYGPSIPTMLGVSGRPDSPDGKSIEPLRAHGVQVMSIGLLVEQDTPMIWRGPMATSALTQLLNDSRWDDLDYLVVDLPPGTGDIQLTLSQKIPVAGA